MGPGVYTHTMHVLNLSDIELLFFNIPSHVQSPKDGTSTRGDIQISKWERGGFGE